MPDPHFTPATLRFLRSLARHNDRDWFNERKATYESALKTPMLAFIESVNEGLAGFAPDYVQTPHRAMLRIYRDIRFSPDKRPYKTHISAWWARQGMEKISGAGFYFDVSPQAVLIAAGAYMPEREQLLAIRRHILEHADEFRMLLAAPELKKDMTPLEPHRLTRAPKGFAPDHPALELILPRQWGVSVSLPGELALSPTLLGEVLARFQLAAPLVEFLNQACQPKESRKPFF